MGRVSGSLGLGGRAAERACFCLSVRTPGLGHSTVKWMSRLPLMKGFLCLGMPSPGTTRTVSVSIISSGLERMTSVLPSRCSMRNSKPVSDSRRLMFFLYTRSSLWRIKPHSGSSFSLTTTMISPGVVLGAWSPSCEKVIRWPSRMPFSMPTSITFGSWIVFLPLHLVQRSFLSMTSPLPPQSLQTDCICCTMPGPIWWRMMRTPRPLQPPHCCVAPSDLLPRPSHLAQRTCLLTFNLRTEPL
mmetsp:Transcript_137/g.467  ORF Transcript_137/g.467 Transcript_137/m.467 type:complete len:243 (-) Transcript_137:478-1206(-)